MFFSGALLLVAWGLLTIGWATGCEETDGASTSEATSSSTLEEASKSGDIQAFVNEEIKAGSAVIVVRALQATFQPAMPPQRLSAETLSAPGPGESFYQAYLRIENTAVRPLRVDPRHFACVLGSKVVSIDPTRSGPLPRSLLRNASLDLVLTFAGPAGLEPVLIYEPPWYGGVITVRPTSPLEGTATSESE